MSNSEELAAIKVTDKVLSKLEDPAAQTRVLQWLISKYSLGQPTPKIQKKLIQKKGKQVREKRGSKNKQIYSIIKDLNLNPSGKLSFKDFIKEKQPKSFHEKNVVAVYYLKNTLELAGLSPNHVFTCYKSAAWPVPANLYQKLTITASEKGWIDTSDTANILLSTQGENYVDYSLPKGKGEI